MLWSLWGTILTAETAGGRFETIEVDDSVRWGIFSGDLVDASYRMHLGAVGTPELGRHGIPQNRHKYSIKITKELWSS